MDMGIAIGKDLHLGISFAIDRTDMVGYRYGIGEVRWIGRSFLSYG